MIGSKKIAAYDTEEFVVELNSSVGTLGDVRKEEQLEALISQLSQYPEALEDYREKLNKKGIDTSNFRPMGSGEVTRGVLPNNLKMHEVDVKKVLLNSAILWSH